MDSSQSLVWSEIWNKNRKLAKKYGEGWGEFVSKVLPLKA